MKKMLFTIILLELFFIQVFALKGDTSLNIKNNKDSKQQMINIAMEDINSNPISDDISVSLIFVKDQLLDSSKIQISMSIANKLNQEVKIKDLFSNVLFYGYSCSYNSLKFMENFSKKINAPMADREYAYPFEIDEIKLSKNDTITKLEKIGNWKSKEFISIPANGKLIIDLSFSRLYKDGNIESALKLVDGTYDIFLGGSLVIVKPSKDDMVLCLTTTKISIVLTKIK